MKRTRSEKFIHLIETLGQNGALRFKDLVEKTGIDKTTLSALLDEGGRERWIRHQQDWYYVGAQVQEIWQATMHWCQEATKDLGFRINLDKEMD